MFSFLRKFDELKNLSEREQKHQPGENSKFKWVDADGTSEEVNIPVSGDNQSVTVDISGNTDLPPNNVEFITITYGGSGVARNLPNPPGWCQGTSWLVQLQLVSNCLNLPLQIRSLMMFDVVEILTFDP